jgi:hypothetical protein
VRDLVDCNLAREVERFTIGPETAEQSIDDYVLLQHSGASFAAFRMGDSRVREFDETLREALLPYASGERVTYQFSALAVLMVPLSRH